MKASKHGKRKFVHRRVLRWYRSNKRELRWRTSTNPYEILVSEVMLQQTQVSRVQQKLPAFLRRFPTVFALARATRAEVIHAWKGMGYNNRAVRLRETASRVAARCRGKIPSEIEQLCELPGIGLYTAHAIACFAFHKQVPVVDVNIRRVLSRVFRKATDYRVLLDMQQAWQLARDILPTNAYEWNQALMDIGSTICVARRPLCAACPVGTLCSSRQLGNGNITSAPRQQPKKREPSYRGVPRRIWRGRIVEALRNIRGRGSISLRRLGSSVKSDFSSREMPWLRSLVAKLEEDGILDHSQSSVRLSRR